MSKTRWKIETMTPLKIAEHFYKHHRVPFNDRASLTDEEYLLEHFNDENGLFRYGNIVRSNKNIRKARKLCRMALKICEGNGWGIIRAFDTPTGNTKPEWRICKGEHHHVLYLKFSRWVKTIFGFFDKTKRQTEAVDEDITWQELEELYTETHPNE